MLEDSFRNSYYDLDSCSPVHPTAVLLIPGTADSNPHSSYNGFPPYYMSVEEITTYWSNYNNTDINPIINQLPNTNLFDGSYVEQRIWENGDNCSRIEELKVIGGDHDWPGAFGNMDIDASSRIWDFVSQFNINGLIECESLSTNQQINKKNEYFIYPNPTTNELVLNSDKVYQIEIFDLFGNKVMEFKGNSINVEHLSSATYIVNAIDLETKESLSYIQLIH